MDMISQPTTSALAKLISVPNIIYSVNLMSFCRDKSPTLNTVFVATRKPKPVYSSTKAELAVTVLLQTKLFLNSQINGHAIDCTQCLAYGSGNYNVGKPGRSSGGVFVTSGRGLEKTRPGEVRIMSHLPLLQPATDLICQQMSYVLNKLSVKQAGLLYHYIKEGFPAHKALAIWADTSRQNISERLKAAGGDLLQPFINYTNAQLNQKDETQQ